MSSQQTLPWNAVQAWTRHYEGAYEWRLPSVDGFRELVAEYGVPDAPNPHPDFSEDHYWVHPMGFLVKDFSVLLEEASAPKTTDQEFLENRRVVSAGLCWFEALKAGKGLPYTRSVLPSHERMVVQVSMLERAQALSSVSGVPADDIASVVTAWLQVRPKKTSQK